jgi:protein TonB
MNRMTVPELPSRPPRAGRPRDVASGGKLPPVLIALGAAALAVLVVGGVVLGLLLFRRTGGSAQEVVGSALPAGWQPGGERGVGRVPPPPSSGSAAPVGSVPPAHEVEPLPQPPAAPREGEPYPEGAVTPPLEGLPPAPLEEPAIASYEPPRMVYLPTPEYPVLGQRMGREGTVTLQVLVGANGRVLAAEPVGERLGMGFEAAARRAAFNARFEPARRNGEPVEGEARIAIRFRLQ